MQQRLDIAGAEDAILEYPVTGAGKCVAGVNDVLVRGAGDHHVLEALAQRGYLRVQQNLQGQALRRVLDKQLVVWARADLDGQAGLFG